MKTYHFALSLLAAGLYHTASGQTYGDLTNIAVDGRARQSTTCDRGYAARAIDGDITGFWRGASVAKTCPGKQSWWKVDLKTDDAKLQDLCIWNRKDTDEDRKTLNGSSLLVMDKDGKLLFDDEIKFDTTTGKVCFDVSNINNAKTVKIQRQKVNKKPLEIAEVRINGRYRVTDAPSLTPSTSFSPTNGEYSELYDLAPFGDVDMSCVFKENIGKRAIDGLKNTFAHTCKEKNSYIRLKLDHNDAVIRKIVLWTRNTENGQKDLNGAKLQIINKNGAIESSQTIISKAGDQKLVFEFDPDSVIGETIQIKRVNNKKKQLQVTEIEVWGKTVKKFPSSAPSMAPTAEPSTKPSPTPSAAPTMKPSSTPSAAPTMKPSSTPSAAPTMKPSSTPSVAPTMKPSSTPSAAPTAKPTPLPVQQSSLVVKYYYPFTPTSLPTGGLKTLTPLMQKTKSVINIDDRGFRSDIGLDERLAARFEGTLVFPTSGSYNLCISSDDGSKLYLNNNLFIDNGGLHGVVEKCNTYSVPTAGHFVNIALDFFEHTGGALIRFYWTPPGQSKVLVPF